MRLGWGHHRPAVLVGVFVVTRKEPLLDRVVFGFRWLGCEGLGWVGHGASGRGVRREAGGQDGAGGEPCAKAWILSAGTCGDVGGLRVDACEVSWWSVSGQAGGKAVSRLQCGADGQVLLICRDSQSISHQAVSHTSIRLLPDSAADRQNILYMWYTTQL